MTALFSPEARLEAARHLFVTLGQTVGADLSVRLWDGSVVPLGPSANGSLAIAISEPGVLGSLLRRPRLETLLRHVLSGRIDVHGGDLLELGEAVSAATGRDKLRPLVRLSLLRRVLPLLLTPAPRDGLDHRFEGASSGRWRRDNSRFIGFHYDMSSEFFRLFLDPEMQYSSAYFNGPEDSLEAAQQNKLEVICRKLRLQTGERLLDVGCGWGGLICWAGRHHGVRAHGLTLSREQRDFAEARIRQMGLAERVSVEVRDLFSLDTGRWDKIASVGMYEHVGLANLGRYFTRLRGLLEEGGIVVIDGMASKTRSARGAPRIPPATRLAQKYLFPGLELPSLDHMLHVMEASGLEAGEVESLREHYALTAREWSGRLIERRDEAVRLVGEPRYRLLLLCLVAMRFGFAQGSMRSYRIVATRRGSAVTGSIAPTRAGRRAAPPEKS